MCMYIDCTTTHRCTRTNHKMATRLPLTRSNLLAELLLDPAVILGPFDSFPQFQEMFPPKYRDHPDTRLLYRAFQRQRRVLREKVAKDIHRRYKRGLQGSIVQNSSTLKHQSLEQAVNLLESKQTEAEEELKSTREEIGSLEQSIKRLSSRLEESSSDIQLPPDSIDQLAELRSLAAAVNDRTSERHTT